jgi:hypothetical protein
VRPVAVADLPRLLVVSDVAVERTGAGSLLLYRLLRDYPADRLQVVYNPANASPDPAVRLHGVEYRPLPYRIKRLVRNRMNPFWPVVQSWVMPWHASHLVQGLHRFAPETVVSVANGFLWFTAATVARRLGVPLHLFLHEDWPHLVTLSKSGPLWAMVRAAARSRVRPIFRRAASRFSVSPGMAEAVKRAYGLQTTVVYPNRGEDSPSPRVRLRVTRSGPPVVAHAGFIHLTGNATLLRELASVLGALGGHLDLYTTHTDAELAARGLVPPIVRRVGFFPAQEMADRLGATADALFLSASFDPADREHESTLFPSKLADYTAVGLPLLVWGPAYSSAARWVAENAGAALLFTNPDPNPLREAVVRLTAESGSAADLASKAIAAGKKYFELSVARRRLLSALTGALEKGG